MRGKRGNLKLPFIRMVILKGKRGVFPGIYRVSLKKWKSRPCFDTKSVKFRSFEVFLVPIESSRRDLQSGHGFEACFWKNKRKKLDFHTFGGQTSWKNMKIRTKLGKFWFPELWMGAKRCGRPARMVFQTTRPEKPWKNKKNYCFRCFFPRFPMDLAQNGQNTRTNGWPPFNI